jgi:hypothetical protein
MTCAEAPVATVPDPRSGIVDGSWRPVFAGQRPPLPAGEPGPALKHGAYSSLLTGPRACELAVEIRASLPLYSPADAPSVLLLALTLARVERAAAALDAADDSGTADTLDRLGRDLRSWIGTATRLLSELGMTPSSRARLGLDVALAQRAADQALERLADEGRRIRASHREGP